MAPYWGNTILFRSYQGNSFLLGLRLKSFLSWCVALLTALTSRTFCFANCEASSYLHCRIPLICESLDVFAGLDPDIHVLVDLFYCVLMLTFELDILVLEVIPLSNSLVPFTNGWKIGKRKNVIGCKSGVNEATTNHYALGKKLPNEWRWSRISSISFSDPS